MVDGYSPLGHVFKNANLFFKASDGAVLWWLDDKMQPSVTGLLPKMVLGVFLLFGNLQHNEGRLLDIY